MGNEDTYNVSFVDGKLHVLRKHFDLRTEINHRLVPSKHLHMHYRFSRTPSGPYYGYAPHPRHQDTDSS